VAPEETEEPPLDLGPTSTPEARALLLAEAMAHADMQEARYRVPIGTGRLARVKGTMAVAILAVAAVLVFFPPPFVEPAPPPALADSDLLYGVQLALLLQAQQVEAFRTREQRLPDTLEDLGASLPGVRFVRSSNRVYQLIAYTPQGEAVVYDSAAPSPEFARVAPTWALPTGP
jgi:hypothetical protein